MQVADTSTHNLVCGGKPCDWNRTLPKGRPVRLKLTSPHAGVELQVLNHLSHFASPSRDIYQFGVYTGVSNLDSRHHGSALCAHKCGSLSLPLMPQRGLAKIVHHICKPGRCGHVWGFDVSSQQPVPYTCGFLSHEILPWFSARSRSKGSQQTPRRR